MFAIEAIKFNHDTNAAVNDALNIRKNATQFVAIPEWRRFVSVNPEDSSGRVEYYRPGRRVHGSASGASC